MTPISSVDNKKSFVDILCNEKDCYFSQIKKYLLSRYEKDENYSKVVNKIEDFVNKSFVHFINEVKSKHPLVVHTSNVTSGMMFKYRLSFFNSIFVSVTEKFEDELFKDVLPYLRLGFYFCIPKNPLSDPSVQLEGIIKQIEITRRIFRNSLSPVYYDTNNKGGYLFSSVLINGNRCLYEYQGKSKGVLYKIRKNGKTLGYLFGTMHYLSGSNKSHVSRINKFVHKKLCECAILGTEILETITNINTDIEDSVEDNLIKVALSQGILNFAIDYPEKNALIKQTRLQIEKKRKRDSFETQGVNSYPTLGPSNNLVNQSSSVSNPVIEMMDAYFHGDVKAIEKNPLNITPNPLWFVVNKIREPYMAQKIDEFLIASKKAGNELGGKPPKAFFAIGISHLLGDHGTPEKNVVGQLLKRGWELELVNQ